MRTHAVIFGAGFGGLELPAELADEADVTLPVGPGSAVDSSGAQGLVREPLPGGFVALAPHLSWTRPYVEQLRGQAPGNLAS